MQWNEKMMIKWKWQPNDVHVAGGSGMHEKGQIMMDCLKLKAKKTGKAETKITVCALEH